MRKLPIVLACTLLMLVLMPSLHAAQPAPAAQVDLAQIFAPANSAMAASLAAGPATTVSSAFIPPTCTVSVCIRECNDCPAGHHGICLSTATCTCGCS